jgi:hypothetical protein
MATILRSSTNPSVGNFNDAATWVNGAIPGTGDIVTFDSSSGSLTINTTGITISAIDFSNFVGTIYVNNTFTVKGNTNVSGGYVQLGTGGYTVVNNSEPAPPSNSNASTTTFMSLITDGNFNIQTNGAECGFILKFNTSATSQSLASASCSGTTLTTTGSPSLAIGTYIYSNSGASLGTISGGSGNTWTVTSGGSYASQTMTAVVNPFNTFTINSFTSKQIYLYTATASGWSYSINGGTLSCKGFVYFNGYSSYTIQGTATLKFIGGGSTPGIYTSDIGQGNVNQPVLALNVTIDTPGSFTINVPGSNGALYYGGTATFTYTSGYPITWTGTNVWGFWTTGSPTWRVGGITLPKMAVSGGQPAFQESTTITYLWIVASASLRGLYGIDIGTFNIISTCNLQAPNTYNVSTALLSYLIVTSSSAYRNSLAGLGGTAYLNVSPSAEYKVGALQITGINASGGRKLWTWDSTVTSCVNCSSFGDISGISHSY